MEFLEGITKAQWHGVIILFVGIAMLYYVQKKRFKRRAITGQQMYNNFEIGFLTVLFEGALNVIGGIAFLLGLFMILMNG